MNKNLLILAILLLSMQASAHVITWQYNSTEDISARPVAVDINSDHRIEILLAANDVITVINATGKALYSFKVPEPITSGITVEDINGDGSREILFGAGDSLYALSATGDLLWKYETDGKVTSTPQVLLPSMDKKYLHAAEIVFGSWDKNFYYLGADGKKIWSFATGGEIRYAPVIGDAEANGRPEVVFGSFGNKVYGIDRPEGRIWLYALRSQISSEPRVGYVNGSGRQEILVATENGMVVSIYSSITDSKMVESWNQTRPGVAANLELLNTTGNKRPEVVYGLSTSGYYTDENALYILNGHGTVLVKYSVDGKILSAPSAADTGGDHKLETVFATEKGIVYAINSTGYAVWSYNINETAKYILTSDLNNDKISEVIVASERTLYLLALPNYSTQSSSPPTSMPLSNESVPDVSSSQSDVPFQSVPLLNESRLTEAEALYNYTRAEYAGVDAKKDALPILFYTALIILSMALIRRSAEKKEGYKELYEHRKILLARKAFLLGKARTE